MEKEVKIYVQDNTDTSVSGKFVLVNDITESRIQGIPIENFNQDATATDWSEIENIPASVTDFATARTVYDLATVPVLSADFDNRQLKDVSGATIIDFAKNTFTHAELLALQTANGILVGKKYVITDFGTKYIQNVTLAVRIATVETLILTGTSVNTFDVRVQSVQFPSDIIEFDITNILCEDGTTARKGKITYRKDTVNQLETHYDFRTILFPRWEMFLGSGIFTVLTDNGNTMNEFLTFGSGCFNISIKKYSSYNNIIFGSNNHSMTFGNYNYSMTFGSNNHSMTFGNYNYSMTFANDNYSMTFGDYNHSMTFGNNNYSMTFGDYNNSMTFGNSNYSMTFGDYNYSMTFVNYNHSMTFGNYNYSMTFANDNYSITFGDYNHSMTFGSSIKHLKIGNNNNFSTLTLGVNSIALLANEAHEKVLYVDATDSFTIRYFDNSALVFLDATT